MRDLRLGEWKYRASGQIRWQAFQENITDENRSYVQKLAVSHWASIDDFRWIEASLPALTSLDISPIKDFVWTLRRLGRGRCWQTPVQSCLAVSRS